MNIQKNVAYFPGHRSVQLKQSSRSALSAPSATLWLWQHRISPTQFGNFLFAVIPTRLVLLLLLLFV